MLHNSTIATSLDPKYGMLNAQIIRMSNVVKIIAPYVTVLLNRLASQVRSIVSCVDLFLLELSADIKSLPSKY